MFPRTGQGYIGIIGFILEDATMACNEQLAQHFGQSNATFTSAQIDCTQISCDPRNLDDSIQGKFKSGPVQTKSDHTLTLEPRLLHYHPNSQ